METWITTALTAEQLLVFDEKSQYRCVLAGAGSGKTRTLTHLIAADLCSGHQPTGIVAFTFTEKAAGELTSRIHYLGRQHLPNTHLTGMYVGTIHSWCLDYLLRQPAFYNFSTIDDLQMEALVSRLYNELELQAAYGLPYPSAIPNFLKDLEVYYNEHIKLENIPQHLLAPVGRFEQVLLDNKLLTFGSMIRLAVQTLEEAGPITDLEALYVDEYQDINTAQFLLIKRMLPPDAKLAVVGDDLQCIYNWRGSDVSRIVNFASDFPASATHRLVTNFRSRPGIIQVANRIAESIAFRDPHKVMVDQRENLPVPCVNWITTESERDQAEAVADIIANLQAEGVPLRSMAILLRSVRSAGQPIMEALQARGVAVHCPILGRGREFIESFLIPLFNWLRTKHTDPRNEHEEDLLSERANKLWQLATPWMGANYTAADFWDAVNDWLDDIEAQKSGAYNVRDSLYRLMGKCGIQVETSDSALMMGIGIASQIIRSVEEVHRRRLTIQGRRPARGVINEVYYALIRRQSDFGESAPIEATTDAVLISTVHQVKGLEWPVVIVPMLVQRRFPVPNRGIESTWPPEMIDRYATTVDDERRLFYVATTRARERLFLLDSALQSPQKRSIFLRDLEGKGILSPQQFSQVEREVWRIAEEDTLSENYSPVKIGVSDLLIYLECPYHYALRRIVGIQPPVGDELGFGKGLHEVIQRRLEAGEPWTAGEIAAHVKQYAQLPYMSDQAEQAAQQTIADRIKILQQIGAFEGTGESEVSIEMLFDSGIIEGVVDNVQTNPDGSKSLKEWKSSIHGHLLPRYERQLQLYAAVLGEMQHKVDAAEIVDVAATATSKTMCKVMVRVDEPSMAAIKEQVSKALTSMQKGFYLPQPGPVACPACDLSHICKESCCR